MAAPGCYGYATVCIKLYSYKCDMYAIRLPTACPHGPARAPGRPAADAASRRPRAPRGGRGSRRVAPTRLCALGGALPRGFPVCVGRRGRPVLYTRGGRSQDRWTVYHSFHRFKTVVTVASDPSGDNASDVGRASGSNAKFNVRCTVTDELRKY
jgi:hypothetical protein